MEGPGDDDEPNDAVEDAGEGGTSAKRTFFPVRSIADDGCKRLLRVTMVYGGVEIEVGEWWLGVEKWERSNLP